MTKKKNLEFDTCRKIGAKLKETRDYSGKLAVLLGNTYGVSKKL